MSKNISKTRRGKSIFSHIEDILNKSIIANGLPLKYLKYLLILFVLGIIYVGNTHLNHKLLRKTAKLKSELEDLRVSYTTLKANYMYSRKQSEIKKKAESLGLEESTSPPYYIEK